MKINLIVAMDLACGIGKDNSLLWRLPADMDFFKKTTTGKTVVMGHKTFESIPEKFRPLPNRENVIITTDKKYKAKGCSIYHSIIGAIKQMEKTQKEIFIIGGGEVYKTFLELGMVDTMYITSVDSVFRADVKFPTIELDEWETESIMKHEKDEKHEYSFEIMKFTNKIRAKLHGK